MIRKLYLAIFLSFLAICLPQWAAAQGSYNYNEVDNSKTGRYAFGGALGFGLTPGVFNLGLSTDFYVDEHLTLGPLVQIGVSDDLFIFAPTAHVKYHFDIPIDGFKYDLTIFPQAGVGFAIANSDPADDTEAGFLINFGFGSDIYFNEQLSLGTSLLFNITTDIIGDNFSFTWHLVQFRYLM